MNAFRFHDPLWFLALVPVIVAAYAALRRGRRHALLYSEIARFARAPRTLAQGAARCMPAVQLAGLALLVVALARPQQGKAEARVRSDAIAIQLVVDRSGSMAALDFEREGRRATRLEVVKDVLRQFVAGDGGALPGRKDDLVGLVVFGGFPETRCPLTFDHELLLKILDQVHVAGMDDDGRLVRAGVQLINEERQTAIGDALAVAVDRLRAVDAASRICILLSDGEQTTGALSPQEGADLAKASGVKVYTVGIGSTDARPVPVQTIDAFGRTQVRADILQLDETTLRDVATTTGGAYFNARDGDALKEVYARIDALERTPIERTLYTSFDEKVLWVLLPGVVLLLVHLLLVSTWLRTLP